MKEIANCEAISEGKCQKCKSLYFIKFEWICFSIRDPFCKDSDGISDNCLNCENHKLMHSHFDDMCYLSYCASDEKDCNKCNPGFVSLNRINQINNVIDIYYY